ncbi:MAG: hypothetical protein ACTS6A_01175 [Candidatus Hodgkinia cicadicola]
MALNLQSLVSLAPFTSFIELYDSIRNSLTVFTNLTLRLIKQVISTSFKA